MQATYNDSASTMLFATGRDYMMRSEKRSRSAGSPSSGSPKRRPPRRRRKRAGFFYKLIMMVLLLVLWPVGLVMLWQRKVRWGVGTKLLTSVVTFAACIILIGFALTVNTNNADYTAMQDKANSFLDVAADALVEAGDVAAEKAVVVYEGAANMLDAAWTRGRLILADGIDFAAEKGAQARVEIGQLIDSIGSEDDVVDSTEEPAADQSTPAAETTPEAEPTVEITVGPESTELPVYIPSASPDAETGTPVETGILERGGVLSTATLPATKEPVITPEPTPEVLSFTVKSAAEAVVYYNEGGKCYHMASECGTMKSAAQHTFGDTLNSSVRRCSKCGTPDKAILDEALIVWTDGSNIAHLTDECAAFVNGWNIVTAAQAAEDKLVACTVCSADDYLTAIANGKQIQVEASVPAAIAAPTEQPTKAPTAKPTAAPTEAPTEEPAAEPVVEIISLSLDGADTATEAPTEAPAAEQSAEAPTLAPSAEAAAQATPTPMMITPTRALKAAGEAIVQLEGDTIHLRSDCSAITGSAAAVSLAECAGKASCETCMAPLAEYAEENCLWKDEDGLCHTGDECEAFNGQYALILRDDALEQGMAGCKLCKASEYLFPRTAINYAAVKKN